MVHGFFSSLKFSSAFEFMTNQMYIIFTNQRFMGADLVEVMGGGFYYYVKLYNP